jgi:hypothetical protein
MVERDIGGVRSSEADFIVSAAARRRWQKNSICHPLIYNDVIYTDTPAEVQKRRKAFLRQ